jgi:cephalosporin hydroxylase
MNEDLKKESIERGCCSLDETGNVFAMQNPNALQALYDLLSLINIELIIEIGTHSGGFTSMLYTARDKVKKDIKIYSFDPYNKAAEQLAVEHNFIFMNQDLMSDNVLVNQIFNEEGKDKRIAVFCDGGNKSYEFNYFSKIIKPGDILGAHDYAKDEATFNEKIKGKVWNWMEIKYSDVESSINEYGLVDLPHSLTEKFENVAWLLKIKNG